MDSQSVITLGHIRNKPLMCSSGELADGLEPHGLKLLVCGACSVMTPVAGGGEVYPGWCGQVGTGRGIPGGYPASPRLRLI